MKEIHPDAIVLAWNRRNAANRAKGKTMIYVAMFFLSSTIGFGVISLLLPVEGLPQLGFFVSATACLIFLVLDRCRK